MKAPLMALLLGACTVAPAWAERQYNEVNFGVTVQQAIANDEMQATLTKSAEHATTKALANTLNTNVNKALALAKKYPNVKVTTGRQHSHPRYDNKGKMVGFSGSVSINVQSQDFEQVGEFIAEVQQFMVLDGVDFGVSQEVQQATAKALKLELIKKFNDEANLTAQAFGAKSYKLIKVNFNEDARHYAQPMMMRAMSASVAEAKVAVQEFAGGDSQLEYGATGSIELVY